MLKLHTCEVYIFIHYHRSFFFFFLPYFYQESLFRIKNLLSKGVLAKRQQTLKILIGRSKLNCSCPENSFRTFQKENNKQNPKSPFLVIALMLINEEITHTCLLMKHTCLLMKSKMKARGQMT